MPNIFCSDCGEVHTLRSDCPFTKMIVKIVGTPPEFPEWLYGCDDDAFETAVHAIHERQRVVLVRRPDGSVQAIPEGHVDAEVMRDLLMWAALQPDNGEAQERSQKLAEAEAELQTIAERVGPAIGEAQIATMKRKYGETARAVRVLADRYAVVSSSVREQSVDLDAEQDA